MFARHSLRLRVGLGSAVAIGCGASLCDTSRLPAVTLYEYGTTRSARCRWLMLEAGVPFSAVETRPHAAEVKALNPRGKLPIAVIDGHVVTESAAICSHLADLAANVGPRLIAPAGTIERAQHDQWVSFALTELDAWTWHSFITGRVLPSGCPEEVAAFNRRMWRRSVEEVLEPHLASNEYLVGGSFSCADVVVGWSLNWGRRLGILGEEVAVPATRAYLARLLAHPHCVLNKD